MTTVSDVVPARRFALRTVTGALVGLGASFPDGRTAMSWYNPGLGTWSSLTRHDDPDALLAATDGSIELHWIDRIPDLPDDPDELRRLICREVVEVLTAARSTVDAPEPARNAGQLIPEAPTGLLTDTLRRLIPGDPWARLLLATAAGTILQALAQRCAYTGEDLETLLRSIALDVAA